MNSIRIKINSFLSYINSIGLLATIDYTVQRYIKKKDLLGLKIPGVKERIYLRRNSKDVNVFQQIFIKKDLSFLKGKTIGTCIDAGANIGLSTIYIKNLFPQARIFSIEPETANIKMLQLNTKNYTDIVIIDKALSEDSNGLFLFDTGKGSDSFQTIKELSAAAPVKIESISIDNLMEEYTLAQLDFVKIDIEGAEEFCINQKAMTWINKSKLLAIEIHEHFVPGCAKRINDLLKVNFKSTQNGEYSIFENLENGDVIK